MVIVFPTVVGIEGPTKLFDTGDEASIGHQLMNCICEPPTHDALGTVTCLFEATVAGLSSSVKVAIEAFTSVGS